MNSSGNEPEMTNQMRRLLAFSQRVSSTLRDTVEQALVPLLGYKNDMFKSVGTATLFAVAGRAFLITARHVLKDNLQAGIEIGVWNGSPGTRPRSIGAEAFLLDDERADVAACELDERTREYLCGPKVPLRSQILPHDDAALQSGLYFGYGLPLDEIERDENFKRISLVTVGFCTHLYRGETRPLSGYDPKVHLLFDSAQGALTDDAGKPMSRPARLSGISGGPFFLGHDLRLPDRYWSPKCVRWAGITSGVYRNGDIIKATKAEAICTLLDGVYPGLARAMQIIEG